ncbi:MAG: hypothetical protein LQ349_002143 [Xanthoria aureola]|nr:MAG: hypothetical protein LQ349_002143 [Xanthoria aureola]
MSTTSQHHHLTTHLATTKNLHPTPQWLTAFLSTQKPTTPLPALTQTAVFRLLSSDITTSLASTLPQYILPPDIHNVNVQESRVQGPVVVQLLGIEDMGKSRWEQVEAIEALERGEGTKGREIIRVPAATATAEGDDDDGSGAVVGKGGGGPHKLSLQDARGTGVYGIELKDVKGVGLGMSIGCKMVLKNVLVARGVLLMEPANTTILGGKIEALHRAWKENRKAELKAAIEANERTARSNT